MVGAAVRYVWVNESARHLNAVCAFDKIALCEGYVRELSTGLLYHDACCFEFHKLICEEMMRETFVKTCRGVHKRVSRENRMRE
jgi:hypothetical protein